MYEYQHLTDKERRQLIAERRRRKLPWHEPPHFGGRYEPFFFFFACFRHHPILTTPDRLTEFTSALIDGLYKDLNVTPDAWVVQPNHYHVLMRVDLDVLRPWLARLHNGKATQWNREDATPKRRVWYRFMDRSIRSERHTFATLNYIHANPVKHGYVPKAQDWPWSSFHEYLAAFGRESLERWWYEYPVKDYGKGWDDY